MAIGLSGRCFAWSIEVDLPFNVSRPLFGSYGGHSHRHLELWYGATRDFLRGHRGDDVAGQFDLDILFLLVLSALWVFCRHRFSAAGLALGWLTLFSGLSSLTL